MNRISRRSEAEAADALLDAGRSEPALHYDVELGLARHHDWLRSEAPLPEWASAGAGTAAKSLVTVAIKTLVSVLLLGALATAAWHARGRPQPSAGAVEQPSPRPERTRAVAPSVREVTASEAWMATTPMPIPEQDPPSERLAHRTVRADVPDGRVTRLQRARKKPTSARAASVPPLPTAKPADATAARVEPAARATAAPEYEPISATHGARPEPRPQAQAPDDLAEMQQVATAEQLLERSPERALALVRQGDQRFARGYFQQERAYIAIMALIRLGRIEAARARAASFAKQFPALPYGARIRSALEARESAVPGVASRDADP